MILWKAAEGEEPMDVATWRVGEASIGEPSRNTVGGQGESPAQGGNGVLGHIMCQTWPASQHLVQKCLLVHAVAAGSEHRQVGGERGS